jgi:hypothetical protein
MMWMLVVVMVMVMMVAAVVEIRGFPPHHPRVY